MLHSEPRQWSRLTPSTRHLFEGQHLLSIQSSLPQHINEAGIYLQAAFILRQYLFKAFKICTIATACILHQCSTKCLHFSAWEKELCSCGEQATVLIKIHPIEWLWAILYTIHLISTMQVFVVEKMNLLSEFYFAIVLDRAFMVCTQVSSGCIH